MKKLILLIAIQSVCNFISAQNLDANPAGCSLDSIYRYDWITDHWEVRRVEKFAYDANRNNSYWFIRQYSGNTWTEGEVFYEYDANNNLLHMLANDSQIFYEYDSNGNLTKKETRNLQGNVWVNYSKDTYTYNSNNKKLSYSVENWNNNAWGLPWTTTYVYDLNNNLINEIRPNYRITNTYDENNNIILEFSENLQDYPLIDSSRVIFTYDSNNNLIDCLGQIRENNEWRNRTRYAYAYDEYNNKTEMIVDQNWNGQEFLFRQKLTYSYNQDNYETCQMYYDWNGTDWSTDDMQRDVYVYDENNNVTAHLSEYWTGTLWEIMCGKSTYTYNENNNMVTQVDTIMQPYMNVDSVHYYYCETAVINNVQANEYKYSVCPNPASSTITIHSPEKITSLRIMDIAGREVMAVTLSVAEGQTTLDVSHLQQGVYVFIINGSLVKKVIKE